MSGTNLLALIDDIATILDDISVMTKIASKKTTGVLGDDLALNAEKIAGVASERELPIIFAVAKGSLINKLILVPCAMLISTFTPFLIGPILFLGGSFLCFEGFEKVLDVIIKKINPHKNENKAEKVHKNFSEKEKIKGAIKTDFILSTEVIIITLGIVAHSAFLTRLFVLGIVSILMTIGVYGIVAFILKIDDFGFYLLKVSPKESFKHQLGNIILKMAPFLLKALGIIGTVAMFLVGGGIVIHSIPVLHHFHEKIPWIFQLSFEIAIGLTLGSLIVLCLSIIKKIKK